MPRYFFYLSLRFLVSPTTPHLVSLPTTGASDTEYQRDKRLATLTSPSSYPANLIATHMDALSSFGSESQIRRRVTAFTLICIGILARFAEATYVYVILCCFPLLYSISIVYRQHRPFYQRRLAELEMGNGPGRCDQSVPSRFRHRICLHRVSNMGLTTIPPSLTTYHLQVSGRMLHSALMNRDPRHWG